MDWMLVAAGAFGGLMVGMTGVGGGAIMTPLLLVVFGVAPLAAVGTDLWFAAITKLFATPVHHRHGLIDWPVVRRLWAGSLTASAATLVWLAQQTPGDALTQTLKWAIGVAILVAAVGLLLQQSLSAWGRTLRINHAGPFKALQPALTVLAGALLGVLVTITSVGAGALGAVILAYLYPLRLTPPRLVATDVVHAIPLAAFAGIGHLHLGHVQFELLLPMLMGSVPAVILGAALSVRLPHTLLRRLLAATLLAASVKLLAG